MIMLGLFLELRVNAKVIQQRDMREEVNLP
jgi:hypothetical protein